jgi:hypothetical protein
MKTIRTMVLCLAVTAVIGPTVEAMMLTLPSAKGMAPPAPGTARTQLALPLESKSALTAPILDQAIACIEVRALDKWGRCKRSRLANT